MTVLGSLPLNQTKSQHWRCKMLKSLVRVSDRQERIEGWNQAALARTNFVGVGAGGLGGIINLGLVKKGAGSLGAIHICDHDTVAPENLNRQLFDEEDLFQNKAIALCRKLGGEGFLGSQLFAHPCKFQDLDFSLIEPDVVVCGVDNQFPQTRLEVCRFAHARKIPAVFVAVTPDADAGYAIVQKPGEACWECIQKSSMQIENTQGKRAVRCPGTPASIDILLTVSGLALYAIDSLVMQRPRNWNYVYLSLSNPDLNRGVRAPRRSNCVVCGDISTEAACRA